MGPGRSVTVGHVTKPQGLKGEVRVSLFDGSVDMFSRLRRMTAVKQGEPLRAVTLEAVRTHGRTVVARFIEATDRAAAESLVGCDLEVPEEDIPRLPSGEFYTYQLEGLEVVTESGEPLGTLEEVLGMPAHDVYVVREGDREVMLPATEEVIKEIDLEKGRVVVHLLEGLLD
jgi:16S rRNA processing protein RimM